MLFSLVQGKDFLRDAGDAVKTSRSATDAFGAREADGKRGVVADLGRRCAVPRDAHRYSAGTTATAAASSAPATGATCTTILSGGRNAPDAGSLLPLLPGRAVSSIAGIGDGDAARVQLDD